MENSKATAKSDLSIFDQFCSQQLATGSRQFLANFARLKLFGGGDEGECAGEARKERRSNRFDPIPDLEQVEEIATKRRRRRAGLVVPPSDEAVAEKKKKTVRFTKTVQSQLYSMEEASPRPTAGGRVRRRVQLGDKINYQEPKEERRLKRPRGHLRSLPQLSHQERLAILGSDKPRTLTRERKEELVSDNGCFSTCQGNGCGPQCQCLLNNIVCDDRCCGCTEENCINAREDLDFEDSMTLRMRAEIANHDLADQPSFDRRTISSVDSFSLLSMYSLAGGDEDEEEVVANGSKSTAEEKEDAELSMDVDQNVVVDDVGDDREEVGGYGEAEGKEDDVEENMDVDEVEQAGESGGSEKDDEDEVMDSDHSDNSTNAPPVRPIQPFTGVFPDVGFDLEPRHFSSDRLHYMPMLLDDDAIRSCAPGEWIDGEALFVGFLKEASRYNEESGSRCAVLHPEAFHKAMRLVKEDAEEKKKLKEERKKEMENRKEAKARGQKVAKLVKKKPAEPSVMDADTVTQLVVYGNQWTELIIPMHLSGNHWAVAVVQRSTVSAVIYDSSQHLASRPKEMAEQIKDAVRKILLAVEAASHSDTTTGRYKIRFCRNDHRSIQDDNHSCGIFAIVHARRVLARGNSNASTRVAKGDTPPDVKRERQNLRRTLLGLSRFYKSLETRHLALLHGPSGQLAFIPKKVAVKLTWSSKCRR